MATFNFTTSGATFSLLIDTVSKGTWSKVDEVDSEHSLKSNDELFVFTLQNPYYGNRIKASDVIQVNGTPLTGTLSAKVANLKDNVFFNAVGGGGSVSIPATAYATNAAAVAALGVGELYKSTTLINGSPIILITV